MSTVGTVSCALVCICCCLSNSIVRSLFLIVCRSCCCCCCCPSAEEEKIEGKQTDTTIMTTKDIAVAVVFNIAQILFILVNIDYSIYHLAIGIRIRLKCTLSCSIIPGVMASALFANCSLIVMHAYHYGTQAISSSDNATDRLFGHTG
jgi:hypothetical protein